MVKLPKFLKQHRAAGAANAVLSPHRFIDEHVFLTKGNQLGIALDVQGIDCECLTDDALNSYTKRAVQAWRIFDDRFRVYQYVLKQDRASIEHTGDYRPEIIRKTISDRNAHLQSKTPGLYTLRLVYVVLLERPPMHENSTVKRALSTKKVLRVFADSLERGRAALIAQTDSFIRNIGDLLGIRKLPKTEAFSVSTAPCKSRSRYCSSGPSSPRFTPRLLHRELADRLHTRRSSYRGRLCRRALSQRATPHDTPKCAARSTDAGIQFHHLH